MQTGSNPRPICVGEVKGSPAILVYAERLVRAPQKATAEKRAEEHDAVIPLRLGPSHLQLVKKPVKVEERGGQLVENKGGGVVVHEGSLSSVSNVIGVRIWAEAYKTQQEDDKRGNRMHQQTWTKDG